MSLLSITLYFLEVLAIVAGIVMVVALGLGLLLVQELNQILSVTEEHEVL
jgi:hypothetical protein